MTERYDASPEIHHECGCFKASVIDLGTAAGENPFICECVDYETAEKIAAALNACEPKQ